jgi:hypothetical protein
MFYPMTFTPINVKTIGEFAFQLNRFFRKGLSLNVKRGFTNYDVLDTDNVPDLDNYEDDFPLLTDPGDRDWYELMTSETFQIQHFLQAIVTPSGLLGIKFSPIGQMLFVIKLTAEGKRVFGRTQDYIAVDDNDQFLMPYLDDDDVNLATLGLPADAVAYLVGNISKHMSYRHEVVLTTSLPLRPTLACDKRNANIKPQFVSYRYPGGKDMVEYDSTMFQTRIETRQNQYVIENGSKTHNTFLLTGTDLQNFHFRLVSRNHVWNETSDSFNVDDIPYPLPEESLWTLRFTIKKLK